MERGLLQLQALVDQVIADTTSEGSSGKEDSAETTTTTSFLQKSKESESAPVTERVRYVFQLATPTRWELESELAARWVQMGGLRSALDIYERLEMWAEAALCWAATDREDKAKRIVRRQLFHATDGGPEVPETDVDDAEEWRGSARDPPPLDAPRLYCILGDIDQSIEMYEEAWKVSKERYARAQRSIGRHFYSAKDMVRAAEAYAKSLKVNQLNQPSWFALGCAYLELAHFNKAVEAFSRCVQLDDTDAESWSNLAAALLRTHPDDVNLTAQPVKLDDDDEDQDEDNSAPATVTDSTPAQKTQHLRLEALKALHRAATLKHDSFRIWENLLLVASSLQPPAYDTMLSALRQILQLRGPHDGDRCLDVDILSLLIDHVLSLSESYDPEKPGLQRMVVKFLDADVVPRITASAELWRLMAKVAVWRDRPGTALDAEEKAWRVVTNVPGWDTVGGGAEAERKWGDVVEATVRLCDGYESLGPKLKTEGMAAGSGEVVMKDWKFKARSAVRGVMGRGKDCWVGTEGWERLSEVMKELKG
jgi:tetratricopeptide (TPR) repeat protein